jgi:SulP family sulfate permease
LRRGGYLDDIGDEGHFYGSKGEAISRIFERLDKNICRRCEKRIFNECKTVPREDEETVAPGKTKEKTEPEAAD